MRWWRALLRFLDRRPVDELGFTSIGSTPLPVVDDLRWEMTSTHYSSDTEAYDVDSAKLATASGAIHLEKDGTVLLDRNQHVMQWLGVAPKAYVKAVFLEIRRRAREELDQRVLDVITDDRPPVLLTKTKPKESFDLVAAFDRLNAALEATQNSISSAEMAVAHAKAARPPVADFAAFALSRLAQPLPPRSLPDGSCTPGTSTGTSRSPTRTEPGTPPCGSETPQRYPTGTEEATGVRSSTTLLCGTPRAYAGLWTSTAPVIGTDSQDQT